MKGTFNNNQPEKIKASYILKLPFETQRTI